jgi:hypothetical protein
MTSPTTIAPVHLPTLPLADHSRARRGGRERERTAYHEAGHAVMAHELGMKVTSVSIVKDDDTLGRMARRWERWMHEIDYNVTPYREAKVQRHIMVCYAGAAATKIQFNYGAWRGTGADTTTAVDLACCMTGKTEETEALLRWLWIRTCDQLARPLLWAEVEATAAALLAHHELTGQEFRDLHASVVQAKLRDLTASTCQQEKGQEHTA